MLNPFSERRVDKRSVIHPNPKMGSIIVWFMVMVHDAIAYAPYARCNTFVKVQCFGNSFGMNETKEIEHE